MTNIDKAFFCYLLKAYSVSSTITLNNLIFLTQYPGHDLDINHNKICYNVSLFDEEKDEHLSS